MELGVDLVADIDAQHLLHHLPRGPRHQLAHQPDQPSEVDLDEGDLDEGCLVKGNKWLGR